MKDPVKLPSGYIVDRVYIHKHVLNDERDPFTRNPLKLGEWTELKDLKKEIAVWKKKRLAELKGANKALKYGKIGQNKKEE
jgi:ubiquitin conjugation factor E4 B